MNSLLHKIKSLRKNEVSNLIEKRLHEFQSFKNKKSSQWFSELCFCILTANSKAATALKIQAELGITGFCGSSSESVRACIMKYKHRFHNNKTKFIILARMYLNIKQIVTTLVKQKGEPLTREWLVEHIKGIGYKEASHFLRNVGYMNLAILDRHILNLLVENGYLKEKPKTLTRKSYLEIEIIFISIADSVGMSAAELDLYMWYMKTGHVLK
jgi:N-glycosylase/DNA lyase